MKSEPELHGRNLPSETGLGRDRRAGVAFRSLGSINFPKACSSLDNSISFQMVPVYCFLDWKPLDLGRGCSQTRSCHMS